jgi:hypothetical protein
MPCYFISFTMPATPANRALVQSVLHQCNGKFVIDGGSTFDRVRVWVTGSMNQTYVATGLPDIPEVRDLSRWVIIPQWRGRC